MIDLEKRKRRLKDIDITAISLVDKGANRKGRFYIIKQEQKEELEQLQGRIFEFLSDKDDCELQKSAEDAIEDFNSLMTLLEEFKDDLPEALHLSLGQILKLALAALQSKPQVKVKHVEKGSDAIDHYPSVPIIYKGEMIDEAFEEDSEGDEEIPETEEEIEELIAKFKHPEKARVLIEKGLSLEEVIEILDVKPVKKSLGSDDDGLEELGETEELSPKEEALRELGERVFSW